MANIKISELDAVTALDGTELIEVVQGGTNKKATIADVLPYKVYTALLSQTGTDAPVATVLQNTLGGTVVWTRDDVGIYTATLASVFTTNKTFVPPVSYYSSTGDSNKCFYQSTGSTESALKFNQFDFVDAALADVTSSPTGYIEIEIRVYP